METDLSQDGDTAGEQTPKAKRSERLLTVDLGDVELKAAWVLWCEERGLAPTVAVRSLVEQTMAKGVGLAVDALASTAVTQRPGGAKVRRPTVKAGAPDESRKIGREIYFTKSEIDAATLVSQSEGYGFHDLVIVAVRAAIAQAPAYGQAEIEQLTQSNLLLSQVAMDLAAWRRNETSADIQVRVESLELDIRRHVENVSQVLAQGVRRWQLKV